MALALALGTCVVSGFGRWVWTLLVLKQNTTILSQHARHKPVSCVDIVGIRIRGAYKKLWVPLARDRGTTHALALAKPLSPLSSSSPPAQKATWTS